MTSIFKPVTLEFKGEQKTIPADQVMTAIGLIENHISLKELTSQHGTPLSKLASGYVAVLNFAGFKNLKAEDVYMSLFDKDQGKKSAADAAAGLMLMMVPPTNYTPPKKTVPKKKPRKKA